MASGAAATAQQQEDWLLAGWERSQYDDKPGPSLGVIINPDRVVVVTGVSSGIGAAIARALAKRGCHVFGSVRKAEDAEALAAELGDFFSPLVFDVTDPKAIPAAAKEVRSRTKGRTLLGLVNNAGMHVGQSPLAHTPLEHIRRQMEVNVVGQVAVTQAFLPLLGMDASLQGKPGCVVNMSSIYGSYALPFSGPYSASKAALNLLSEALRRELRPFGIRVVILKPGPIRTGIWEGGLNNVTCFEGPYERALAKLRRFAEREWSNPAWFLPPEAVGERVWKALSAGAPAASYVVTPDWPKNWLAPTWLPTRLIDRAICARFGLLRPKARAGDRAPKAD
ncbi:hypothetical protein WJX81_003566 [Elliptochloris bilobata]|uniref:PID domain-containing protein n=1 Tax=Elliptochloris bilobata TaxID=381761 RepID=A0AAW1RNI1_9CHLO